MKRASYRFGVDWIAKNDEPCNVDLESIRYQISVLLLADLFQIDSLEVAKKVLEIRQKD